MTIKNTAEGYGAIAKWLHWATAILFLASYFSIYYRHWFTEVKSFESMIAFQLHLSVGVTIAVIVVLRIVWRITNRIPDPEPGTFLEHTATQLEHYALYAVMIILPATGYLGTVVNTNYFFMFEIPRFSDTQLFTFLVTDGLGISFKEFKIPVDFIHKNILGEWLAWFLILDHVLVALSYQFVKKGRTMSKMTTS